MTDFLYPSWPSAGTICLEVDGHNCFFKNQTMTSKQYLLELDPDGYPKFTHFTLFSKIETYLCDKMHPHQDVMKRT